jgi:vesicle coat complex subunit
METLQSQLNLKSMVDFVRLNKVQQITLLTEEAILLDLDTEKSTITRLYFYKGFFIEEVFSRDLNEIVDIIPYKQGFRIKNYLKEQTCRLSDRPFYFQYCIN